MSDGATSPEPQPPPEPQPVGDSGQFTQRIQHQQLSARVPEDVGRGIFSTGALVFNGPHEFVVDFLQSVTRPHQVAARVILTPTIMPSVMRALQQNLEHYRQRFGPPPELPRPPKALQPPSVEEIYDQLKLPDGVGSGVYANAVMITHTASEFCFDFIASFYPRSTVAARVYMSVPQAPRFLETLTRCWDQFRARQDKKQDPPSPQPPPGAVV